MPRAPRENVVRNRTSCNAERVLDDDEPPPPPEVLAAASALIDMLNAVDHRCERLEDRVERYLLAGIFAGIVLAFLGVTALITAVT